jgi:hypothetical protein
MRRLKGVLRAAVAAGIFVVWTAIALAGEIIPDPDGYFPDALGSQWKYRGQVIEGAVQSIALKEFLNVSTVKGSDTIKGVKVKVFHDTNPGNNGPSDSFYRRDAAGIVYYGSHPGTPLEKQLVPYQIVRFPLEYPSSFQQFDRQGLSFGSDLDGDEQHEKADVQATVSVIGKEAVSVPAGTYQDAVRIEARMIMRIHLTGGRRTMVGSDTMTAWFAKGVGLVKYVERQEIPSLTGTRGRTTEITEELEEVEIKPQTASLGRSKAAAERVFADHPGHQELAQILLATSLRAHSR